jgi:hypothetical protein
MIYTKAYSFFLDLQLKHLSDLVFKGLVWSSLLAPRDMNWDW